MTPSRIVLRRNDCSPSVGMEVTESRNVLHILQPVTAIRIFIGSTEKTEATTICKIMYILLVLVVASLMGHFVHNKTEGCLTLPSETRCEEKSG